MRRDASHVARVLGWQDDLALCAHRHVAAAAAGVPRSGSLLALQLALYAKSTAARASTGVHFSVYARRNVHQNQQKREAQHSGDLFAFCECATWYGTGTGYRYNPTITCKARSQKPSFWVWSSKLDRPFAAALAGAATGT